MQVEPSTNTPTASSTARSIASRSGGCACRKRVHGAGMRDRQPVRCHRACWGAERLRAGQGRAVLVPELHHNWSCCGYLRVSRHHVHRGVISSRTGASCLRDQARPAEGQAKVMICMPGQVCMRSMTFVPSKKRVMHKTSCMAASSNWHCPRLPAS